MALGMMPKERSYGRVVKSAMHMRERKGRAKSEIDCDEERSDQATKRLVVRAMQRQRSFRIWSQ